MRCIADKRKQFLYNAHGYASIDTAAELTD